MRATKLLFVQNDDVSGPGTLEQAARDDGWDLELWMPYRDDTSTPDPGDYAGVVAFGGRVAPGSQQPWLKRERSFLVAALRRGVPYLGICLGAELLAQVAAGSTPGAAPDQVGWRRLSPTTAAADDPVLNDLDRLVFEWHYNGIRSPGQATVLATTGEEVQAFRVGHSAWGVQFHLEVDLAQIALFTVLATPTGTAPVDGAQLRRESAMHGPANAAWARRVMTRFGAVCRGMRSESVGTAAAPRAPRRAGDTA